MGADGSETSRQTRGPSRHPGGRRIFVGPCAAELGRGYRGGVVSLIEVLDADSNLLQVRDAKAAQTEAARAAIASLRALGGGWDTRHAGGAAPTAPFDEQVQAHRDSNP